MNAGGFDMIYRKMILDYPATILLASTVPMNDYILQRQVRIFVNGFRERDTVGKKVLIGIHKHETMVSRPVDDSIFGGFFKRVVRFRYRPSNIIRTHLYTIDEISGVIGI